jgi:hypothetical protein
MSRKLLLFVVVLTLSSWAAAQGGNKSSANSAVVAPADTTCAHTFHSGTGWTETQYCVTANGNITQFSNPAGSDNIAGVWPSEGYGICDFFPATPASYYDYATNDSGNWGPTTLLSSTATSVKFVRVTSDGLWQLTQTITELPASAQSPASAKVAMALKNLTAVPRTAYLMRFADIDAFNQFANNDFLVAYRTVSGSNFDSYGLTLTANTFFPGLVGSFILNTGGLGPDPCHPDANAVSAGSFHGDGAALEVHYFNPVPKGGTKTAIMTYKPM